jgi:hypothetical protein
VAASSRRYVYAEPWGARPLFERALDLRRCLLGGDHPDTLESAGSVSFILWGHGQYEQTRQLSEAVFSHCRWVLGEDHPLTPRTAFLLASALWESGHYEAARQLGEDPLPTCAGCSARSTPTLCARPTILSLS